LLHSRTWIKAITTIAIVSEEEETTATLPSPDPLHEKTAPTMVVVGITTTTGPLIGPTSLALLLARTATASPDLLLETVITIHIIKANNSENHSIFIPRNIRLLLPT
jgi:hypothetical protein